MKKCWQCYQILSRKSLSDQLKVEDLKMRKEHQTLKEGKTGGLETANANVTATSRHAESYAAAQATNPIAVTQFSDDDDAVLNVENVDLAKLPKDTLGTSLIPDINNAILKK